MRVRSPDDLGIGLILLAFAAIGFWLCWDLRIGTASHMGPGYMPFALCFILIGLGLVLCARGLAIDGRPFEHWKLKPLLIISISIAFFSFAIERLGLVIAVIGLVFIGSFADSETRRGESALLSIGLAAFCVLVFVKLLGLPMQLWPDGLF